MEEFLFFLVLAAIIGGIVWLKIMQVRAGREVAMCQNCQNRMPRKRFKANAGCVVCGSDLMTRTGVFADRGSSVTD